MPRRKTVAYGPHRSQMGELWLPKGPHDHPLPVVVLIHGGFWRSPYSKHLMRPIAKACAARGYAAWNIEYRRLGLGGGHGGWPNTFEDVATAIDHLAQFPEIDKERVIVCGHSAGGHLALWAAARDRLDQGAPGALSTVRVHGAIALAGLGDLEEALRRHLGVHAIEALVGGSYAAVPDRYRLASPAALLPFKVPQVLLHGLADTVVPASLSEHYQQKASAAGDEVRYLPLAGLRHRSLISTRGLAWKVLLDQLDELSA